MDRAEILFNVCFVVAAIIIGVFLEIFSNSARKREKLLESLAARLGLVFDPKVDSDLPREFGFLNKLARGHNRYACNLIYGKFRGYTVDVFDYHFEANFADYESQHETGRHDVTFFILQLPRPFHELTISRHGPLARALETLPHEDIHFESAEFSRIFRVKSPDKKLAYEVCNARMMEYLLANDDLAIEIDGNILSMAFNELLSPEKIEYNINRLVELRNLIPDHVFEDGPHPTDHSRVSKKHIADGHNRR